MLGPLRVLRAQVLPHDLPRSEPVRVAELDRQLPRCRSSSVALLRYRPSSRPSQLGRVVVSVRAPGADTRTPVVPTQRCGLPRPCRTEPNPGFLGFLATGLNVIAHVMLGSRRPRTPRRPAVAVETDSLEDPLDSGPELRLCCRAGSVIDQSPAIASAYASVLDSAAPGVKWRPFSIHYNDAYFRLNCSRSSSRLRTIVTSSASVVTVSYPSTFSSRRSTVSVRSRAAGAS